MEREIFCEFFARVGRLRAKPPAAWLFGLAYPSCYDHEMQAILCTRYVMDIRARVDAARPFNEGNSRVRNNIEACDQQRFLWGNGPRCVQRELHRLTYQCKSCGVECRDTIFTYREAASISADPDTASRLSQSPSHRLASHMFRCRSCQVFVGSEPSIRNLHRSRLGIS